MADNRNSAIVIEPIEQPQPAVVSSAPAAPAASPPPVPLRPLHLRLHRRDALANLRLDMGRPIRVLVPEKAIRGVSVSWKALYQDVPDAQTVGNLGDPKGPKYQAFVCNLALVRGETSVGAFSWATVALYAIPVCTLIIDGALYVQAQLDAKWNQAVNATTWFNTGIRIGCYSVAGVSILIHGWATASANINATMTNVAKNSLKQLGELNVSSNRVRPDRARVPVRGLFFWAPDWNISITPLDWNNPDEIENTKQNLQSVEGTSTGNTSFWKAYQTYGAPVVALIITIMLFTRAQVDDEDHVPTSSEDTLNLTVNMIAFLIGSIAATMQIFANNAASVNTQMTRIARKSLDAINTAPDLEAGLARHRQGQ